MKDLVTISRIPFIHPFLRVDLANIYSEICTTLTGPLGCRFVQVFRTFEEQNELYAQGRTKPGKIVTNSKGGQSYHNYGLAVDFCLLWDKNGDGKIANDEVVWDRTTDIDRDHVADWMEVVKIFVKYGWTWGASFGDYPHFENKMGYDWRELLQMYTKGNFIQGTKYINLV